MDDNRDVDLKVSELIRSMMKGLNPDGSDDPTVEQAIIALVKSFRELLQRQGDRIYALEERVADLEAQR